MLRGGWMAQARGSGLLCFTAVFFPLVPQALSMLLRAKARVHSPAARSRPLTKCRGSSGRGGVRIRMLCVLCHAFGIPKRCCRDAALGLADVLIWASILLQPHSLKIKLKESPPSPLQRSSCSDLAHLEQSFPTEVGRREKKHNPAGATGMLSREGASPAWEGAAARGMEMPRAVLFPSLLCHETPNGLTL